MYILYEKYEQNVGITIIFKIVKITFKISLIFAQFILQKL